MAVQVGVNSLAQDVEHILSGIGGEAVKITKGYVGVNGTAHLFWLDTRTNLYSNGNEYTWMTGGWNKAFTFQTSNGGSYTMRKMTNDGTYMQVQVSATSGNYEVCCWLRSVNPIDVTGYSKLCCTYEYYMPTLTSNTPQCRFGLFGSSFGTMRWNGYDSRFLAYNGLTLAKNNSYQSMQVEVDVSSINGTGDVLFYTAFANMKANYNARISKIWLEKEQQS